MLARSLSLARALIDLRLPVDEALRTAEARGHALCRQFHGGGFAKAAPKATHPLRLELAPKVVEALSFEADEDAHVSRLVIGREGAVDLEQTCCALSRTSIRLTSLALREPSLSFNSP